MQPFLRDRSLPGRPSVRAAFLAPAAIAALALALVVAGCGSGPAGPGVAQLASAPTTTASSGSGADNATDGSGSTSRNPAAYSSCMRAHGVPKFPDPDAQGGIRITAGNGLDPDSPQFKAADKACQKLLGSPRSVSPAQQAKAQEQMLKFSACMRAHGLANFPDPVFEGNRASLRLDSKSGLNPNSPQFKAAQKACQKEMPAPPGGGKGGTTFGGRP